MEKTGFEDTELKFIWESDILEDKEGNIAVVVWIKEWGMFGACRCQPTRIVFSAGIYKHLL